MQAKQEGRGRTIQTDIRLAGSQHFPVSGDFTENLAELHSWTQVKMRNYLRFYGIPSDPHSRLDDLRDRIVKVLTTAT